jgi:hypothetical protein
VTRIPRFRLIERAWLSLDERQMQQNLREMIFR